MRTDKNIPFRYVFDKIKKDVFRVLLVSALFHTLKIFFANELPEIPFQLPTVLGTSISLILAFNLNQSYDRWWEARKVWGHRQRLPLLNSATKGLYQRRSRARGSGFSYA